MGYVSRLKSESYEQGEAIAYRICKVHESLKANVKELSNTIHTIDKVERDQV